MIEWLSSKLGVNTNFVYSSNLDASGSKTELLVNICNEINANHYLSPAGSKKYIDENNLFVKSGIKLSYQYYKHPTYNQLFGDFISNMSVIDLLFNEGEKSLEIIRRGSFNE